MIAATSRLSLLIGNRERRSAKCWCAGRDLTPHGISTTSPSNSRVCHSTTRAKIALQSRGSAARLKKYYYLGGAGSNGLLAGAEPPGAIGIELSGAPVGECTGTGT